MLRFLIERQYDIYGIDNYNQFVAERDTCVKAAFDGLKEIYPDLDE